MRDARKTLYCNGAVTEGLMSCRVLIDLRACRSPGIRSGGRGGSGRLPGMVDTTTLLTGAIAAGSALGGVLITVLADGLKDRRRLAAEKEARRAERVEAEAARRRTFELENLVAAYDSLWLLARDMAKAHSADMRAAQGTAHGYGGTLLPDDVNGTETDLLERSKATKTIRLILDNEVRSLALQALDAMDQLSLLGVKAKIFETGPVSAEAGVRAAHDAVSKVDAAMNAIADRIRVLAGQQ